MKAMIFAAGIGSRLKPFTDFHPKALAPVKGVPALERVIKKLKAAGIAEMVVNVHHFSDQVKRFISDNDGFGCDIKIADESCQLLDTGGGLLNARDLFGNDGESILLHNADIVTDFSVEMMMKEHERSGADVTLMAACRNSSRMLYFDDESALRGWKNLSTGQTKPESLDESRFRALAFGGVHIVNPRIFALLGDYATLHGKVFSIMPFYLEVLPLLNIRGYVPSQPFKWHDIGTPGKLEAANG